MRAAAAALSGELIKLWTLPAGWLSILGTWVLAAVAAAAPGQVSTLTTVEYAQAGLLVLGVVATASEYAGGQHRISLVAVPRRGTLLTAKGVALGSTAAVTATVALGVTATGTAVDPVRTGSAVAYLVLVTELAGAVTTVVRRLLPTVAALLGWFLIVAPLARPGMVMGFAPDALRADEGAHGAVVMLAWTSTALAGAAVVFLRRDA